MSEELRNITELIDGRERWHSPERVTMMALSLILQRQECRHRWVKETTKVGDISNYVCTKCELVNTERIS